jgi:hypothetical protein
MPQQDSTCIEALLLLLLLVLVLPHLLLWH